ncbi:phosphoribosyl-AMP cyclohydrolase [Breznakia pachnodae]|uniref:Phosphoribosyl-AMP cyclohydrolase n=1 Tax=Breznakia pachnodae TaxID=265178 RepID=A0ABU0DY49_9FIRM|nr:phosphoribosyl-AMP cyclohydrolase [Breznakia pachnodae]MDQ0359562.1 phosphoribosyl-AMP cyclohydrolase [Breznakia pachnodae]
MIDKIDFEKNNGLIPVIVQEDETNEVLMMAYMNKESLQMTLDTKIATYYSRSRNSLWVKGETSGHYQHVLKMYLDCDYDTILMVVKQDGVACHTGEKSCFFNKLL